MPINYVAADPASNYNVDGTITIVVPRSGIGNPTVGQSLTGFVSRIAIEGGASTITPDNMGGGAVQIDPIGSYLIVGNLSCRPNLAPLAALVATPTSGEAPLNVTLNATASSDPDAGDTIATYAFNYGDGTTGQQSTPTVMHTYTNPGTYRATVVVTDSRGKVSENVAAATIEVGLLRGITSRKAHGAVGEFDIDLPVTGTAGIECRNPGAGDSHSVIFTFVNPLVSVGSATVNAPLGSPTVNPTGTGIGPESNQYTVNLTGVNNAQLVTVTLNNIQDTTGAMLGTATARMSVLLGDVTPNGVVNSSDVGQTKAGSGNATTNSNFRADVTANGSINSSDVGSVKAKSGTALP